MNYEFVEVNEGKEIMNPEIKVSGVNIVLTDENGKKFGVAIPMTDLNIDDKVLKELEKYKV